MKLKISSADGVKDVHFALQAKWRVHVGAKGA